MWTPVYAHPRPFMRTARMRQTNGKGQIAFEWERERENEEERTGRDLCSVSCSVAVNWPCCLAHLSVIRGTAWIGVSALARDNLSITGAIPSLHIGPATASGFCSAADPWVGPYLICTTERSVPPERNATICAVVPVPLRLFKVIPEVTNCYALNYVLSQGSFRSRAALRAHDSCSSALCG